MVDILHTLHHEHRHFQRLIDLMHGRFERFRYQASSDYIWLLDSVRLIKRYHASVHQPVEDLLLEKLLVHAGKAHDLLKPLFHEDRLIFVDHSSAFIDALNSAINGSVVSRDMLATLGEKSLRDLSRQIAFEERAVFPLGKQLLSDGDWKEIGRKIENLRGTNLERQLLRECMFLRNGTVSLPPRVN